eukprot:CAMPEP_0174977852 /NCGR_PEP_ID=MMETSP0004_2-20121128/13837_1 /TAXON_ID=420556 /ORGANISM="Ochromonas sp., Strain CCMP1393" /LENGTH=161 /DNA_ID=CAMNT_0016229077 /DNA_START=158 /DNA_END=643 /DNA_ORIENTATION=-
MQKHSVHKSAPAAAVGKRSYLNDVRKFQVEKLIREDRQRAKEVQRFKKAAQLRKYAKLCKSEGIVSDRVRIGSKDDSGPVSKSNQVSARPRPFRYEEETAKRNKLAKEEKEILYQEKEQEKAEALRRREEKRKALGKKNKKGQPVLGNHIKSLLEKIHKSQ